MTQAARAKPRKKTKHMKSISVFEFTNKQIRTTVINGEVWFVAKDVCDMLEVGNVTDAMKRLPESMKGVDSIETLGGSQRMNIINEPGVYKLAFTSRKPEAESFTEFVAGTILPTIRKHGMYATDDVLDKMISSPEFGIKLLTELQSERQARIEAEHINHINAPKVIFADAVSVSQTSILVGDLAKILKQNGIEIGANRLFSWLRENGYLIKRWGMDFNMPTQRSMNLGLFAIKETVITHSDGHTSISKTTKVTGKGQQYFIAKFLSEKEAV